MAIKDQLRGSRNNYFSKVEVTVAKKLYYFANSEEDASIHLFFVNLPSKLTQWVHLKMTYLGALLFLVQDFVRDLLWAKR